MKAKRKRAPSSNPFFASTVKQVFHLWRKNGEWHWKIRPANLSTEDSEMEEITIDENKNEIEEEKEVSVVLSINKEIDDGNSFISAKQLLNSPVKQLDSEIHYVRTKIDEEKEPELDEKTITWESSFSMKDKTAKKEIRVELTTNYKAEKRIDFESKTLPMNRPITGKFCHFSPSLMKSILQKNVRLGKPWPAVRTALHLIKQDFQHFIRRLSIIMIEDALLHPQLPFVIWLTEASSKPEFILAEKHVNTCLEIVYQLAFISWRDAVPLHEISEEISEENTEMYKADQSTALIRSKKMEWNKKHVLPTFEELDTLPTEESELVKCILIRAAFGGMYGDVAMLENFAYIWYDRFKNNNPPSPNIGESWLQWIKSVYGKVHVKMDFKHIGALVFEDVILSAVDFHCSSVIDWLLQNAFWKQRIEKFLQAEYGPAVDIQNKLRSLIWIFRSSLNTKKFVIQFKEEENEEKEKLRDLWVQLKGALDQYSIDTIERKIF